jgi:hypothetical protein
MIYFRYTSQTYPAVLCANVLAILCFGLLLDGGQLSTPGSLACVASILVASYRAIYVKITKKKVLISRIEHCAWILMPLYVIPAFILLFYFGSYLRHGHAG